MAFTRVKAAGWAYGEVFTSSQANQLDIDHANAIDGAAGGTYALSAPLIIGGDDVEVDDLIAAVSIESLGTVDVGTNLTVTGTSHLVGNVTMDGDVTIGTSAGDALQVVSSANFINNVTLGGTDSDIISLVGVMNPTTNGRILQTGAVLPDSSSSVDILQNRFLTASLQTATRVTTLTGTAVDGDWFVFNNDSSFTQTLAGLTAGSIATNNGIMFLRISGGWYAVMTWTTF